MAPSKLYICRNESTPYPSIGLRVCLESIYITGCAPWYYVLRIRSALIISWGGLQQVIATESTSNGVLRRPLEGYYTRKCKIGGLPVATNPTSLGWSQYRTNKSRRMKRALFRFATTLAMHGGTIGVVKRYSNRDVRSDVIPSPSDPRSQPSTIWCQLELSQHHKVVTTAALQVWMRGTQISFQALAGPQVQTRSFIKTSAKSKEIRTLPCREKCFRIFRAKVLSLPSNAR